MAGYPDDVLDARLELLLGAWTDVTLWALPDGVQYAQIKSGQPDGAQQPVPASLPMTWDNGDGRFSPRNVYGPYYGLLRQNTPARMSVASPFGSCLRLEADSDDRAFVDDTAALHVTGSIEARIELQLSDWRGCMLACRRDGTLGSWHWYLQDDGTLAWGWWDSGGTFRQVTSTVPVPFTSGVFALRVTLDAASAAVTFYVSDGIDGTWTQIGSVLTVSGLSSTSVRAGNCPLVAGWSATFSTGQLLGSVREFRLYNGIGGALAADGIFAAQAADATGWTDPQGNLWQLAGGAEISDRDYRLHGELSVISPVSTPSGHATVQATVSGRMRRLQQGYAPQADSPMRRAVLSQQGDLYPVAYWPMEDGTAAPSFGPAAGPYVLRVDSGTVRAAADTTFEASAALPQLGGAVLGGDVQPYSGATAWAVRFLCKLGSVPSASELVRVTVSGGACATVVVTVPAAGQIQLTGYDAAAAQVFQSPLYTWAGISDGLWCSVEAVPDPGGSGGVLFNFVTVAPGATTGLQTPEVVGTVPDFGTVTGVMFNRLATLADTVIGHVSVQKAWTTMFTLGAPLNAWRGELAANRFARVCGENGIACRIAGYPALTQAMGPQPHGSVWSILQDCVSADQGILFEPSWACSGVGFRTLSSMTAQQPALTLDFGAANLPGDLQPADDDMGLVNDVTASTPDGTVYRLALEDGSSRSVSEPKDGGAGRYASSPPGPLNVVTVQQLAAMTAHYLGTHTADEPRYRNVTADFGVPGAPAADAARLRPGDLIVIRTPVPPGDPLLDSSGSPLLDTSGSPLLDTSRRLPDPSRIYQSGDIRQLAMGAVETLGPGRKIAWDCVPASPYDVTVRADGTFESGVGDWFADGGTVVQTNAQQHSGTYCAKVTASGTPAQLILRTSGPYAAVVSPSRPYTAWMWLRGSSTKPMHAAVDWYDASGTRISTSSGQQAASFAAWALFAVTDIAPPGAVTAVYGPTLPSPADGDYLYCDDVTFTC